MVTQTYCSVKFDRVIGDLYAALNDYKRLGWFAWFCGTKAERILRSKLWNAIRVAKSFEDHINYLHHCSLQQPDRDVQAALAKQRNAIELAVDDVYLYAMAWAS